MKLQSADLWCESYLLVELDVLQNLDGLVVVAQQRVQAKQPHQAEIAQHLVERVAPILPSHALWVSYKQDTVEPHQLIWHLENE